MLNFYSEGIASLQLIDTMSIAKTHATASITRDAAHELIRAVRAAAVDHGVEVAIAITDAGGHLVAFERSDKTPFLAGDVAIDKAWTSASFGLDTHVWNAVVRDPKVTALAYRPRMTPVGGGLAIKLDGRVIGGVGVSGASADQDQQAAEIGLRALGFQVEG